MTPARFAPEAVRTPFVEAPAEAIANAPLPGTRLWWLALAPGLYARLHALQFRSANMNEPGSETA